MNLRDIKKDIEYVIGAFIDDCSLFSTINKDADDEALGGLLDEAVSLYNELKDKVNAKAEGKNAAYYAGIRKELLEKTDALYEKLSKVVKDADKVEKEEKPKAEKPKAAKPKTEKPKDEKPAAEKPKAAKPKAAKPKTAKPKTEKPKAEESK